MRGDILVLLVLGISIFGCVTPSGCGNETNEVCGTNNITYMNPCLAQAAGVKTTPGACETFQPCSDTDSGRNLLEAGFTKKGSQEGTDACASMTSVQEYYCQNDELKVDTISCPSDMECDKGKCVDSPCSDSDGGFKSETRGIAKKGNQSKTDYCESSSSLKEYGCSDDGFILESDVSCNCEAGRCVPIKCADTDSGKDPARKGVVSADANYTDSCINATTVKEYYCENNALKQSDMTCSNGFSCSDGACVANPCSDTDGGKDKEESGTVRKGGVSYPDVCYDGDTVQEFYCYSNEVSNLKMDCDPSDVCIAGRCRMPACTETDNGYDPEAFGSVRANSVTRDDSCQNDTRLKEYSCTDEGYNSSVVDCFTYFGATKAGVCYGDVCEKTSCNDTDKGKNKTVSGAARVISPGGFDSNWMNDVCINSRSVKEYYCQYGWAYNLTLNCDLEQRCSGGLCIEAACEDTDGGKNYTVAGTVTKGDRVEQDSCTSTNVLNEWYCSGNNVTYERHTCPAGCNSAQRKCNS